MDDKGVIHIPVPEPGGWGAVLRAFCSKYSIYRLATIGLTGEPTAAPSTCSKNWPWKEKEAFFKQNSNRRMMSSIPMTVLSFEGGVLYQ